MPVPNEAFQADDVYIDYPQESVFYRWNKASGKVHKRFYHDVDEHEADYKSHMFSDSRFYGSITSKERYLGQI